MPLSLRRLRHNLVLLSVATAAGCSDVIHPEDGPVESIVVEPANVEVEEGAELRLTARLYSASGGEIQGRSVFWASEDPDIANLSGNGTVQGLKRGTTRVAASAEGKHGVANVVVVPVPVGTIQLSPNPAQIPINETVTMQATVRDRNGATVTDRQLTWSSSTASVARVNSSGVVTALVPGTTTITATAEGVQGSAEVIVTQGAPATMTIVSGNSQQGEVGANLPDPLVVRITDAEGHPVPDVRVQWSAQNGSVTAAADRTNGSGEASATWRLGSTVGEQRATARAGDLSAAFTATGAPRPVTTVTITPDTIIIAARATRQLQAVARDRDGGVLNDRPVSWNSSATNVATVSDAGVVTGVRRGQATITATVEGVSGTALVTVRPGAPAELSIVSGNNQEARTGTALPNPLLVQVADADGNAVPQVTIQWATQGGSLSPQSGPTNADGRASSVWTLGSTTGPQTATAAAGSLSIQFNATATEVPVASVQVSPAVAAIVGQGTQQLNAVARDSGGNVLARPITWSSSNSNVAQVNNSGLVTGVSPGLATIKATASGVEGTAEITVAPGPPAAISVASGSGQEAVAGSTLPNPLVVRVTDAGGHPISGVPVQWTAQHGSVAPTSGPTNADGRASSVWTLGSTAGPQTATAAAGSLSIQFNATATAIPVANVEVSPAAATIIGQSTQQLTAVARDSNGNVLVRPIEWSSSNSNVAEVSNNGLVTGVSPGLATIKATAGGFEGTAEITVAPGPPAAVSVASGSGQQAAAGSTLPNPLVAKITDAGGNPVPGVAVQWIAEPGSGSVAPTSATSNASGEVTTTWTLGPDPGTQRASATVNGLTAQFTATAAAVPVPVATVEVSPDSSDIGVAGNVQLQATVRDADGNVLTGRPVSWSTSNALVATVDQNGRVVGLIPGTVTITATSEGVDGTAFVRVSLLGPTSVSIVSGNNQVAEKRTTLPELLVVRVTDPLGNGVPSVTVYWSANRGGSVSPSSSTTDAFGLASTAWTLGEPVGGQTVNASIGELSVSFAATSLPPATEELVSAQISTLGVATQVEWSDPPG